MLYKIIIFLLCATVSLLLTSCNFAPKYKRDTFLLSKNIESKNPLLNKVSTDDLTEWWERLDDPLTTRLVKKLLNQNLTLKSASEKVFQAREFASIMGASQIPVIDLESGVSSVKTKGVSRKKNYTAGLAVSWQVDLFGKLRSAKDSAEANALAQEYDLQGITQVLIADIVTRRVAISLNNKLLQLAESNVKDAKKLYKSVKTRYELGAKGVKLSDVYLAQTYYESSKKDVFLYQRLLSDEVSKLEILLSQMPGSLKKANLIREIETPKPINVSGIPAELMDRRPDLKSAEIKIIAANSDIGVAIADLFPDLLINTGINYSAINADNLLVSRNMSSSVLGKITARIFAGGALRSNIKIKESKARMMSLDYANKVIKAAGEVESNLNSDHEIMMEYKTHKASVKLFERNKKHSNARYVRGVESLSKFLENKRKTYNANRLLVESERALWKSRISLYLSLGGDWLGNN